MDTNNAYWRSIPRRSLILFLLGVFLLFSAIGFTTDISEMGRQTTLRFVLNILISGIFPVFYALVGFRLRNRWYRGILPLFVLHFVGINAVANLIPDLPQPAQLDAAGLALLHRRLTIDAVAIIVAVIFGYACLAAVSVSETRRYFRLRSEIELAKEIHHVLVPVIDTRLGGYEFYGRSSASGDVGGDLIDLAGDEEHWVAYVADVSGHGVAPGVVMGMVKSAARMLLSSGDDSSHLMPRLNEVLFPLKKPDMFVTFCFVARNCEGLRVGLAGHPAILHFSAKAAAVTELDCPNMPLGVLPSGDFKSSEIRAESGDVFALYTDGLLETANPAGEEFGLARLKAEIEKRGTAPLPEIFRAVQESVARHGPQFDDQSLLLIRQL